MMQRYSERSQALQGLQALALHLLKSSWASILLDWALWWHSWQNNVSLTKSPIFNHRIIESFRLEKTLKIIKSNYKANTAKSTTWYPLNTSRECDSTTTLCSLFQCLITFLVEKFFLIHNLNLPWCNLRPSALVLSLVTWEKTPTPTSLQPPLR